MLQSKGAGPLIESRVSGVWREVNPVTALCAFPWSLMPRGPAFLDCAARLMLLIADCMA